ncbi:MAG: DUF3098 domain-containing protein [Muribaculaceae bacterium]|jgi:hypothetical protein|uniref:DUF3098 domain-containing protein n=1 Tax=Bacteroidales TaxID=171549 RepID=UPI000E8659D7|nr:MULTISPECIES: DUF3098 domain-containing protein [Bacteroidales]MBJ2193094.1 DUF3098 domain-containing protein [Muribaculaceae bacterium]ROS81715.1 DUF3098 domain-containing protein [Muribaculaceae bacterium Isolate-036 (Harlan)]RXE68577.1 DUF3098 domain-containing protein [Muribaculaceae bacterium Isolate-001 (NCI)]HBY15985.1 DUF3098 domain-containing protein [Porphyromonadaceae bacterium]MBJ2197725.1 DUF3098 domain-containing protein [Muribaculaceae bacterium]
MTKLNNKSDSTVSKDGLDKVTAGQRPFSKINFWMMGGCLALIIIGFLLMSGGGTNGTDFNPEVFSTRRIVVGPLLAFLGFLLMAISIVWIPKSMKK